MASHYVSFARGVEGSTYSHFTTGVASSASDLFEFRVLDGVRSTKVEVVRVLKTIERFFENAR